MPQENNQRLFWLIRPDQMGKDILRGATNHYNGFLVDATLAPHICNFVKDTRKPFIVNPMLYVFSLPTEMLLNHETGKIRNCYQRMAQYYGQVFQKKLGKNPLTPLDYNSIDIDQTTENILHFQDQKCSGQLELSDIDPILQKKYQTDIKTTFLGKSNLEPNFYLAPYFCCDQEGWYDLSLKFTKSAIKVTNGHRLVYAVIFLLAKTLRDTTRLDMIINDYSELNVGGYIIWINNLRYADASLGQLLGLKYLITKLSQTKKPIINLYGGYFSATLNHFGLSGFASGLAKSEGKHAFRPFIPNKEFKRPKPNYYIYKVHQAVDVSKAEKVLKEYHALQCSCKVCRRLTDNFSQMVEPVNAYSHFMNIRHKEFKTVSAGLNTVIKDLKETISELGDNSPFKTESLKRWKQALED